MKKSWVLLLVLLVGTVVSSDGLASVHNMQAAIKRNPVAQKFMRGAAVLGTSVLLLTPSMPAEVLVRDAGNFPQAIQQPSPATGERDLISLQEIYRDFSYSKASDYIRLVKLLDQGKVDVNARDAQGNTVLLQIVKNYPRDEMRAYRLLRLLLVHGADPEVANDAGESAYAYVAEGGDYKPEMAGFAALLAEAVHGINGTDDNGLTPLDYALWLASYSGDTRLAKQLVVRGADVRRTEIGRQSGYDTLQLGAELADSEKFSDLAAEQGGIAHVVEKWGEDLLIAAVRENNGDVVGLLLDYGVDPSAGLFQAAQIYRKDTIAHHITDPNAEMLTLLLNHEADVNAIHPEQGFTAMHAAADNGNYLGMEILLQRGGNPSLTEANGGTVLHTVVAREQGYASFEDVLRVFVMTNMLLAHDVNVHVRDNDLQVAYNYVVKEYRKPPFNAKKSTLAATAAILLKAMGGKDTYGKTAAYWAELSGSEIVQELMESEDKFIPLSGDPVEIRNTAVIKELIMIKVLGKNKQ